MHRPPAGSYRSAYSDQELLVAVRQVAAIAGSDGELVTRARFDDARARAGHPALPSADRIARWLGEPFSEILRRACSGRDQTRWTARRHAPTPRPADPAEALHALRVAAAATGARSLTPGEYRRVRAELLAQDRAHHRHGRRLVLPDEHQIAAAHGDWEAALRAGGLSTDRALRPSGSRAPRHTGIALEQALEWCVEYHGALASWNRLRQFARAHDLALERLAEPWEHYVQRMRNSRTSRGRWTPPGPLPWSLAPDFAAIIPESEAQAVWKRRDTGHQRRNSRWSGPQCLDALGRFLTENPGVKLTQRSYADWVAQQTDRLPQVSAIQRHGRFSELVADAHRRLRRSQSREL